MKKQILRIAFALLASALVPATIGIVCMLPDLYSDKDVTAMMKMAEPPEDMDTYSEIPFFFALISAVAFVHALALGLPSYFLLNYFRQVKWWTSILCGFFAGAMPIKIFELYMQFHRHLMSDGSLSLLFGSEGMIGGFAAWLTWWLMRPKSKLVSPSPAK